MRTIVGEDNTRNSNVNKNDDGINVVTLKKIWVCPDKHCPHIIFFTHSAIRPMQNYGIYLCHVIIYILFGHCMMESELLRIWSFDDCNN